LRVPHVATDQSVDRRRWWRVVARLGATSGCLVVLGVRLGSGAFAHGVGSLTVPDVAAAFVLTAVSTACAAWRWWVVARVLDVPVPGRRAVPAYYRSQFLNSVLPGGVVGDADRAVTHGRDVDDLGRAARAVIWDRTAGQVVQIAVTIVAVAIAPAAIRLPVAIAAVAVAVLVGCAAFGAWHVRRRRGHGSSWPARVAGAIHADLRTFLRRPVWPVLVAASLGVIVSHVALFVLVARVVDPAASISTLVPLAVVVLTASAIPLSVAGWGLREGAAAWAFAAAGIGAATGVAASTAYGVASLIAVLPGALVLATDVVRRHHRRTHPGPARPRRAPAAVLHG
jgi:glycosyltransferase 2 family protein